MATEIWIPIKGYEMRYEVSDLGRVRSLSFTSPNEGYNGGIYVKTGKVLTPMLDYKGQIYVALKLNTKTKRVRVKNLVAEAFEIKMEKGQYLYCVDTNPYNCGLANLVAAYRGQNLQDIIISDGKHTCLNCGDRKSLELFYEDNSSLLKRSSNCIDCTRERSNQFYIDAKSDPVKYEKLKTTRKPHSNAATSFRRGLNRHIKKWDIYSSISEEIKDIYKVAREKERVEGVLLHVDHIVPLKAINDKGEHVATGLHVPWNLQIIDATVNIKKKNKLEGK
jgi:5-methylcytosine-specific restriction endonuclease McrA